MRAPQPILGYNDIEDAFWLRVKRTPDGCWEWQGGITSWGYGNLQVRGRQLRAHRVAYALANGPIPDGLLVCHTCDNRACCRPSHFFVGTHQDNNADKMAKGRQGTFVPPPRKGEANERAKLTDAKVQEMRVLRSQGALLRELSERFGVSIPVASKTCRHETWRHVQ